MAKVKAKKIKVEFINSPTGVLNLAYNEGESASFEAKQAKELIDKGFAKEVK